MDSRVVFESVSFSWKEPPTKVFSELSLALPGGLVSFVGPNGTGKSTLMLLAGGRVPPDSGRVLLLGRDTRELGGEEERNLIASFVYQNMEFETEEAVERLLPTVAASGNDPERAQGLIPELVGALSLKPCLKRRTQELSKGELQRVIIAFSLLYASPVVFMDEPVFAMEPAQKEAALDYLRAYAKARSLALYISIHELDLTRKYADSALLFGRDGSMLIDEAAAALSPERLEAAYGVPAAMLHEKEALSRSLILERARLMRGGRD
jgi:iron complex transport system ATP-binding protein